MAQPGSRITIALCAVITAAVSRPELQAAAESPSPIEVRLVSEQSAIVPGRTFTVAIHQRMAPGYHTYWRNPGTLGLPSGMQWRLPPGFTAGEIQWPVPQLTKMAAYTVWGYEREALLLIDITAPGDLTPGGQVELRGLCSWMCCGKLCHPDSTELRLRLPVAADAHADPRWREPFAKVRQEQPRQPVGWQFTAIQLGESIELKARSATADPSGRGTVRFFGYRRQVSSDKEQQFRRTNDGFVLVLQVEEHTPELWDRLTGIVVAEHPWQPGIRVLDVDVPILSPAVVRPITSTPR